MATKDNQSDKEMPYSKGGASGDKEANSDTKEEETSEGVKLTEEFQQKVYDVLNGASKAECDYVRNCCYDREDVIRKEKEKSLPKGKQSPSNFNTEAMPID